MHPLLGQGSFGHFRPLSTSAGLGTAAAGRARHQKLQTSSPPDLRNLTRPVLLRLTSELDKVSTAAMIPSRGLARVAFQNQVCLTFSH